MKNSDLIKTAMTNIISDYNNIADYEKKTLIKNVKKPLYDSAGSWAFLFQYIPDELSGPEDELSLEEMAIIRAAQLYFYHRNISKEEVHINSDECYFKLIDKTLHSQPQEMDYAIKRLREFEKNVNIEDISSFIYFIDLVKGDFKADYIRLATDLLNA